MTREAMARGPADPSGPAGPGLVSVEIRPADAGSGLRRFLRFPWQVYAADPAWVPPLLHDVRSALDRRRHPFHRHAEVALFLAERGGRAAGRIAAIHNRHHNEFHEERAGFFGLFECEDDPETAGALLERAESWLRERDVAVVRGPMNLSTNDEIASPGVLVDGFARPPAILMGHAPPYYAGLIETAGYVKAKDLFAYWIEGSARERLIRSADRLLERAAVRIRPIDLGRFEEEVAVIQRIYNNAWEKNWGFVPMSAQEIQHLARQLRPVVNPQLCAIAYIDGEPAAFALALPDFNQAIRHANGRLFPFGLLRILWHRRRIDAARVLTLGVTAEHRNKGLGALLNLHLFREGNRAGYLKGECSWILEDNWEMRRGLERLGAVVDKTYRVYEKVIRA